MNWREYILLSHAETQKFSLRRSIVGIVLIVVACLVAGIISLSMSGKLKTCTSSFQVEFEKTQVKDGGEGCQGTAVSVGELVYGQNFTYVVTQGMRNYRAETLQCDDPGGITTMNVVAFAAPQFVWDYEIVCTRPDNCCPVQSPTIPCSCSDYLMLNIQDIGWTYTANPQQLLNSSAAHNYSSLNDVISSMMVQNCPGGERATVLYIYEHSYSAFNSSGICSGDGGSNSTLEDQIIALAIDQLRDSINTFIANDLKNLTIPRSYECVFCSPTHNIGPLLLNLLIAISALGSITYSIVIWLLKVTLKVPLAQQKSGIILEMPIG